MTEHFKIGEEFQKVGKEGFEAAVRSYGDANKGFQAIIAEVTSYSKKSIEDGTRAFEQLLGAKSFQQVIEIQSQYARMVYEANVAELSKLGEMYVSLAQNAFVSQGWNEAQHPRADVGTSKGGQFVSK